MVLSESNRIDSSPRVSVARMWCLCVLIFTLLYALTCQHGVSWQDSGEYQWRVLHGDISGQMGIVRAHPLYIGAGQIIKTIPVGTLSGRLNFFSGLGMAIALANLAALLTLLTRRKWIGVFIAILLALTHTVWWLSTIAEVYTWSVAGLTAELWLLVLLVRKPSWKPLIGLAFVSGLGLSLHNFALLPIPVYLVLAIVLILKRRLGRWSLAAAAGAWMLGAGLYLELIVQEVLATGDIVLAMRSALFGRYAPQVLNAVNVSKNFKANMALSSLNFISVLGPLAIIGWFGIRRRLERTLAIAFGAITVIEVLFFVRYSVPDQFTFILPTLIMLGISAGIGLSILADLSRRVRICTLVLCIASVAALPVIYAAGPTVLRNAGVRINRGRKLPFRDEMRYWLTPWKHNEDSAERFSADALGLVAADSVILTDSTSVYPLLMMRDESSDFQGVQIADFDFSLPSYDDDPQEYRRVLADRSLYIVSLTGLSVQMRRDTEAIPCPLDSPVLYRLEWKPPAPSPGR